MIGGLCLDFRKFKKIITFKPTDELLNIQCIE